MSDGLVIAEHGDLVFLRKRAGVPVFPPHAAPDGPCLLRDWLAQRPQQGEHAWPEGFGGGIAHRLDTPTSGIVVACRHPGALEGLRGAFASGALLKHYRFVSAREVSWREHLVERPIAHDRRRSSRMVVQRGQRTPHRGRWYPAHTELSRLEGGCWQAVITTGVTHQIRVHAAFVGLALAGDRLYGGGELPPEIQAPPGASFMLHHARIVGPGWASPALPPPAWWGPYGSSG
jgi:23S rRNA-/tRNA-specific pseudouridylate synthase